MKQREIEKRWLVKGVDVVAALNKPKRRGEDFLHRRKVEIEQAYLEGPGQLRVRITTQDILGSRYVSCELTRKEGKGLERVEDNKEISEDVARMLISSTPYVIKKTRYDIDGWELDMFHGNLEGLVLLEREYKGDLPVEEIVWPELPDWVSGCIDVTETLSNKQLATLSNVLADDNFKFKPTFADIPRIVLTGGPCAGKSTIIEKLRKRNDTHCVPEIATILMGQIGVMPEVGEATFQRVLYRVQRSLEDAALKQAIKNGKSVVVFDRGTLDSVAFVNGGAPAYCDMVNTSIQNECDNYDRVLLLGVVNEPLYIKHRESNPVRRESWKEAKVIEAKLRDIWSKHRNFFEIGDCELSQKEALVMSRIGLGE